MPYTEPQLRKNSAIRGLYVGLIALVINIMAFYFITLASPPFWLMNVGLFFIYIVTAVIFIENLRRSIGGYWVFKHAVTGIFILVTIAYAVNYVGRDVIFSNLIERNVAGKTKDAIVNADVAYLKKNNISQDSINKNLIQLNQKINTVETVSGMQQVAAIPILLIMLFVVSLVFAAVFKRDPPVYKVSQPDPTA